LDIRFFKYCCIIDVLGKPVIEYDAKLKEKQRPKVGSNLSIVANISGTPTPTVQWFLADEPITSGNGVSIVSKDTVSTLAIKGINAKNVGQIKIVAKNKVGSDSAVFVVEMKGTREFTTI